LTCWRNISSMTARPVPEIWTFRSISSEWQYRA